MIGLCPVFYAGQHSVGGFQSNATPTYSGNIGMGSVTSGSLTAGHLGGTSAYTYAWSQVLGPPGITINSPTASSTTTTAHLSSGDNLIAYLRCTVTDGASVVVKSNQITLQFTYG